MAEALPIIKPNTITGSSVRQRLRDTVPAGLAERLHRAYVPPTVCLSCAKTVSTTELIIIIIIVRSTRGSIEAKKSHFHGLKWKNSGDAWGFFFFPLLTYIAAAGKNQLNWAEYAAGGVFRQTKRHVFTLPVENMCFPFKSDFVIPLLVLLIFCL